MDSANASDLAADTSCLLESLADIPGQVAMPTLVIAVGLAGTGKSSFSTGLAERVPFAVLGGLRKSPNVDEIPRHRYSVDTSRDISAVIDWILKETVR